MSDYEQYRQELVSRFRDYQRDNFKDNLSLFDPPEKHHLPVFCRENASNNIIIKDDAPEIIRKEVIAEIPEGKRHKWFRSMSSSQALAQSIFGNLKVYKKLDCLANLRGDDGKPLFIRGLKPHKHMHMEFVVNYLNEPRPTSVDVFFKGDYRIAVECKLSEPEVGPCSRPNLRPKDSNYKQEYCSGRYEKQRGRSERCSLSSRGIQYWQYIPQLFNWSADTEHNSCPLNKTYQLVRNVLAACVRSDGELDPGSGHAVLLYDARNPAFKNDGKGWEAWKSVKKALKDPSLLQACTWQQFLDGMSSEPELSWLINSLQKKYGF